VDPGDLLGVVADRDGQLVQLTAPLAPITIALRIVPAPTTVPPNLVGRWSNVSSEIGSSYTFSADGSYVYVFRYRVSAGGCLALGGLDITQSGRVRVEGDQITFIPASGSYVSYDCHGVGTRKPPNLQPVAYRYAIVNQGGRIVLQLIGTKETVSFNKG
jgi:hypothetical protein